MSIKLLELLKSSGNNEPLNVDTVFNTSIYTGTGVSNNIVNGINLQEKGGLVWIKRRAGAGNHLLYDTIRGPNAGLNSNNNLVEGADVNTLSNFNVDGFTLGSDIKVNGSGSQYVAWSFRESPRFLDIIEYTGTGSVQNIFHQIGQTPGLIIIKCTSHASDWIVHSGLGFPNEYFILNSTGSVGNDATVWNGQSPQATLFRLGTSSLVNANGRTYIAYVFGDNYNSHSVIATGTYSGSGVVGNAKYIGWEPQFVMVKNYNNAGNWVIEDSFRDGLSADTTSSTRLQANLTDDENGTGAAFAATATGFTCNKTDVDTNAEGSGYLYFAIRKSAI